MPNDKKMSSIVYNKHIEVLRIVALDSSLTCNYSLFQMVSQVSFNGCIQVLNINMVEFEGKKNPKTKKQKTTINKFLDTHDARCNMMITMMLQMPSISSVIYLGTICH